MLTSKNESKISDIGTHSKQSKQGMWNINETHKFVHGCIENHRFSLKVQLNPTITIM